MGKKLRAIVEDSVFAIIDIVGSSLVILVAFGCSILLDWILRRYLSDADYLILTVMQMGSAITLALVTFITLYGKVRIQWIEMQGRIQKAKAKSEK